MNWMDCWSCSHNVPKPDPLPQAFAVWFYDQTNFKCLLCKKCLDHWLDNADCDPYLEPSNVVFL